MLLRIIFLGFFTKEILAGQRFEQQPSYTEVNPGQDAYLECKVFNKRGSCSWQKDNKPMGMYPHKYEWISSNQQNGDCSIWVRAAQLEFDDGSWECQVTASDFHTQDALTSHPVRLVVRVPPQRPRIEFNGTQVLPGHNLTTLHGEVAVIKCVSHYGNPPPVLKWFLDQQEITPSRRQTNTTELDNTKTWLAVSVLELTISKENHGRMLSCVAVHESYSTKSSSIEVRLDVMFVPETRLVGIPTTDIEDLKDSIAIRCVVSANPKASVVWRREGQSQPASLQELLQFSPAIRQHSGLYTCHARNKAGDSVPIRVQIDVKYRPKVISVGRERVKTSTLFAPVNFECLGEGNPPPTYQWIQKKRSGSIVERGTEAKLNIRNVTYEYQGEWRCKATNIIKGEEQSDVSEPIILQVYGAPQVLRHTATPEIFIESGQSVDLSVVVCADPRPRSVAWEWGSLRLEAGNEMGKFKVDEVTQEEGEDCYLTTLHVKDTSATDSRTYYLLVENDKGKDTHAVQLYVNEPLQMSTLVSVAGALLVGFLVLVCICIYAIKAEKCCFSRKGDFKPSDIDGKNLDIEKTAHHQLTINQSQHPASVGGIPADAIYTTGPRGGTHPDAMKPPPSTTHTFNGRTSFEERYHQEDLDKRYRSFSRYEPPKPDDNWSYANKYKRRSLNSRKNGTFRPKPLQLDNEKYYDLVFPKQRSTDYRYVYEPNGLDRADL
ncbi:unnamed protein product [Ceutorhynchus assimilis]|uniref:Ig-like domain-containing protein n=1 Tax=Ceutorhynchus assimilis TaxID=467358 RepID=A0A9P0GJG6_9CUCU|nr:unnamed protein product [Ceutorhynchus assimilis]